MPARRRRRRPGAARPPPAPPAARPTAVARPPPGLGGPAVPTPPPAGDATGGTEASSANTSRRRNAAVSRSSRPSSVRPATRSATDDAVMPFQGSRAAVRCSVSSRPYGARGAWTMAIRSNAIPASAAATTRRRAVRTSSSSSAATTSSTEGSAIVGAVVVAAAPGGESGAASRSSRSSNRGTGASARPVTPTITVTGACAATACSSRAAELETSWGRWTTSGPSSAAASPLRASAAAVSIRSVSSCQRASSRWVTRSSIATTAAARASLWARRWRWRSSRSRSSRWTRRSASTVDGWSATGPNRPGSSARAARNAVATTGEDTGTRPDRARVGPASSSARRYKVTNATPITPWRRASARRAATPA